MKRAAGLLALALCAACGEAAAPARHGVVWRALDATREAPGTVDFPRVELAAETRPVLFQQPQHVLRWRERVNLPSDGGALRVPRALPADLAPDARVAVDTWISVRPPAEPDEQPQTPQSAFVAARHGSREVLRDGPVVVDAAAPGEAVLSVPAELSGRDGLLSALARVLPDEARVERTVPAVPVPRDGTLGFAIGVEEPGWSPGWPPVRFRVRARSGAGERVIFERSLDPARNPEERRWHEVSLPLAPLGGGEAELVFEAEALPDADSTVPRSLPVFANPEVWTTPAAGMRNVVLVSLDTLRARSVGAYGARRDTSPRLDEELAAAGALVRQAVTPFPFTPPSHVSMLTGLSPCLHGVRDRHGVVARNHVLLPEWLRAEGFQTAAFTENGYVSAAAGFSRGFDVYFERRDEARAAAGFADETFRRASAWLEAAGPRPFFLFVHTYEVHGPYEPPERYRSLFEDEPAPGVPPRLQQDLRNYERETRYTDELLAGMLALLDRKGLADDTLVVVTSDHGESFGEHGVAGHGFDTHDEAILVPMVVRAPGLVAPGTVVEAQVSLMDVVPTVLELLGLPLPADLEGQSFAGPLTGRPEVFEERPVLVYTANGAQTAVRTSRFKLIEGRRARLYDPRSDPLERERLDDPELLAEARAALAGRQAFCERWLAEHPPEPVEWQRDRRAPGWLVNRDDIDAQLRALGYAE